MLVVDIASAHPRNPGCQPRARAVRISSVLAQHHRPALKCATAEVLMSVRACRTGIGLGIAQRLAQEGAAVMISSRKQANVDETVAALREEGLDVRGVACHVGSLEQVQRLIQVDRALSADPQYPHLLLQRHAG